MFNPALLRLLQRALQNAERLPVGSDVSTWRPPRCLGWPASPITDHQHILWGQPCVALHTGGTAFLALPCVSRQDVTLRTRKKCPSFFSG